MLLVKFSIFLARGQDIKSLASLSRGSTIPKVLIKFLRRLGKEPFQFHPLQQTLLCYLREKSTFCWTRLTFYISSIFLLRYLLLEKLLFPFVSILFTVLRKFSASETRNGNENAYTRLRSSDGSHPTRI
jgi:hypothetical protein